MRRNRLARGAAATAAALACITVSACGARLTPAQHAAGVAVLGGGPRQGQPQPSQGTTGTEQPTLSGGPTAVAQGPQPSTAGGPTRGSTGGISAPQQNPSRGASQPSSQPTARTTTAAPATAGCAAGTLGASDTGVTATTVRIGNSADVTGPIPGLFSTAQNAVKAFVAYFNGTGQTICGRQLVLDTYDSQTSETGDHDSAAAACSKDFALVGSLSAFDNGGAPVVQSCGIPDLRAEATNGTRQKVPNEFGANSQEVEDYPSPTPTYFASKFGADVVQKAAYLYINAGAGADQAPRQKAAFERAGWHFVYFTPVDISDFNYSPYVQAMKDKGVQIAYFLGAESQAGNFMKAVKTQNFNPAAIVLPSNMYGDTFPQYAGPAANGAYTFIPGQLLSEQTSNAEAKLYAQWLDRVAPGDKPSYFGEFAWSAVRLFVEQAQKVGPNLTRKAMIDSIKSVKGWTDHGLHSPQEVGAKKTGVCETVIQWNGSDWVRITPSPWTCGQLLSSS